MFLFNLCFRKVAKVTGEGTSEDNKNKLEQRAMCHERIGKKDEELKTLIAANKKLNDEIRGIERNIKKTKENKDTLTIVIDETKLENDMTLLEQDQILKVTICDLKFEC
jgi:hypothetical protein